MLHNTHGHDKTVSLIFLIVHNSLKLGGCWGPDRSMYMCIQHGRVWWSCKEQERCKFQLGCTQFSQLAPWEGVGVLTGVCTCVFNMGGCGGPVRSKIDVNFYFLCTFLSFLRK